MKRVKGFYVAFLMALVFIFPALAQDHPQDQPLKAAVDLGYVPFAFVNEQGEVVGFSIDLAKALAERLGRPGVEIVAVPWSGIFAALDSGRVEFIVAPTNIRPSRAENMLFTEPWADTAQAIAVNARLANIVRTVEDLKGLTIGVNTGSVADDWVTEHQRDYGFEIERFDNILEALLAVETGRIDAVMADIETLGYAVKDRPNVVLVITIKGQEQYGLPCRKGDREFRNLLERALEGLKLDGTLQALYKKWFGVDPDPTSATNLVYAGYGVPGLPGYELTPHRPLFAGGE